MKKYLGILLVFISAFTLTSCINATEYHDVYVTVYPMQYIAEEIFEGTEYTAGIVPGVTSHESSVDWSPKEIIAMTEANFLFYVGANYDQYIDNQINSIFINKDVQLIKIEEETDYIQFIEGEVHECNEDGVESIDEDADIGIDPHFWVSPERIIQVAELMFDYIIAEFDDSENIMQSNYDTLKANLQALSDDFFEVISNANNHVMTSTNIYGYLRTDYGFDYISISPGYHEEVEQFTSQEQQDIVDEAIEHNIKYLIYEMYSTSPLSNAIFSALEEEGLDPIKLEFNILQALSDDNIEQGSDYISVMYENLDLLIIALGYEAE